RRMGLDDEPLDFSKPGPYGVGVKHLQVRGIGQANGSETTVSVFYPGDTKGRAPSSFNLTSVPALPWFLSWVRLMRWPIEVGGAVEDTEADPVPILPPTAHPAGYPVIFFHHGFPSFRLISARLVKQWASYGFVVIMADHPGRIERDHVPSEQERDPLLDTEDIYNLLAAKDPTFELFHGLLDLSKVAICGESGGALPVVSPKLELNVVKAAKLYIAMVMDPVQATKQYPDATHPPPEWGSVLVLGGMLDTDRPRNLELAAAFWQQSTVRVVLLEDAPHIAWNDAGMAFEDGFVKTLFAPLLGHRRWEIDPPCLNFRFCHIFAFRLTVAAFFEVFPTAEFTAEMSSQVLSPSGIHAAAASMEVQVPKDLADVLSSNHHGVVHAKEMDNQLVSLRVSRKVNLFVQQKGGLQQAPQAPVPDTGKAAPFQNNWARLGELRTPKAKK
ncbi:unnamed protein product, partial [Polarella glacialis]